MPFPLGPFHVESNTSLSVSGSNAHASIGTVQERRIMVTSPATNPVVFIKFGTDPVTAATTDTPILPGSIQIFSVTDTETGIGAITGGTSGTLYVTIGEGQ